MPTGGPDLTRRARSRLRARLAGQHPAQSALLPMTRAHRRTQNTQLTKRRSSSARIAEFALRHPGCGSDQAGATSGSVARSQKMAIATFSDRQHVRPARPLAIRWRVQKLVPLGHRGQRERRRRDRLVCAVCGSQNRSENISVATARRCYNAEQTRRSATCMPGTESPVLACPGTFANLWSTRPLSALHNTALKD